jgi:hypothetical protein
LNFLKFLFKKKEKQQQETNFNLNNNKNNEENDDSSPENEILKRKAAIVLNDLEDHHQHQHFGSASDRFKTSINNCTQWLQTTVPVIPPPPTQNDTNHQTNSNNIKIPDMRQPPPPLPSNFIPLNGKNESKRLKLTTNDERIKKGLPSLKEKHLSSN